MALKAFVVYMPSRAAQRHYYMFYMFDNIYFTQENSLYRESNVDVIWLHSIFHVFFSLRPLDCEWIRKKYRMRGKDRERRERVRAYSESCWWLLLMKMASSSLARYADNDDDNDKMWTQQRSCQVETLAKKRKSVAIAIRMSQRWLAHKP